MTGKVSVRCPICDKPMALVNSIYFKSFMCTNKKCIDVYEDMEYDLEDDAVIQASLDDIWEYSEGEDSDSYFLEDEWTNNGVGNTELET